MKKIGILYGQENTFPQAFVDRVNELNEPDIKAELIKLDKVIQGQSSGYSVIIDRISQDVPFYRAYLKNEAITGTAVINNPFWWSADDKFLNNALALKVGVAVPKTVVLPSKQQPPETTMNSFRNLKYPLNWDAIFSYVGFPAFFKPFTTSGGRNVHRVENIEKFFRAYDETGQLVMMLQEEIVFTDYFRCYCVDRQDVHIMQYDPHQPNDMHYVHDAQPKAKALLDRIRKDVLSLNKALGYDFNAVELAVKNGIPYAIDFCDPSPDADLNSIGEENFAWVVDAVANMAIRKAKNHKPGKSNCTWGEFVAGSIKESRQ